jgi:hypothetical protein
MGGKQKMAIKEFLKTWKPKKVKEWDKEQRMAVLRGYLDDIVSFYIEEGHRKKNAEVISELFDRMASPKFVKTLQKLLKDKENPPRVDLALAMVINTLVEWRYDNLDAKVVDAYRDIIDKLLKKRVKKVAEKTGLSEDLIKELLVVVTHPQVVVDDRYIGVHVRNVLRKLYAIAKENDIGLDSAKSIRKLFKQLFGEDALNYVAIAILLERKDTHRNFNERQLNVWNRMTEFALDTLEKCKKGEIEDLLIDRYVNIRIKEDSKGNDGARRIQFSSISEENYPKIRKVTNKLSEKEKYAKYL